MLAAAAAACEDKKAEDIRILALDPAESGLADYFLICTGANDRQTVAITDEIELRLKREFSTYPNSVEGRRQGEWVLMDYVDFIVHVFLPEKRAYYGLERLRPSANTLSVNEINAEVKAAIAAGRPRKVNVSATAKGTKATKKMAEGESKTPSPKKATAETSKTVRKAAATRPASRPAKSAKKTLPVKAPAKRSATRTAKSISRPGTSEA